MLKLLLTCEHGGNNIPTAYQALFAGQSNTLASHEGYDIGALELFHELEDLADVCFYSETSRLLVELNRSLHHKKLFSVFTRDCTDDEKNGILKHYYYPYRNKVEQMVQDLVMAGRRVLHVAVHSFTPELNGEVRNADIGLLYDPKRRGEQSFSKEWKEAMLKQNPDLIIRNNYPYLGIADGLPTYLRKKFKENEYLGIELEVNQKFPVGDPKEWQLLKEVLQQSLYEVMQRHRKENPLQEQEVNVKSQNITKSCNNKY